MTAKPDLAQTNASAPLIQ